MRLLPYPVEPKPMEIFSSWVCRNALENGLSLGGFCNFYFRGHLMNKRDIDKCSDNAVFKLVADITGVQYSKAEKTLLLRKLKQVLPAVPEYLGTTPWVTHTTYIFNPKAFGNCFCPQCFASDKKPYMRLDWRLAFITFCPYHRTLLHDRCFNCGVAHSLYRLSPDKGCINYCHQCGYDLSHAPPKQFEISDEQIHIQNTLLSLLDVNKVFLIPSGNVVSTATFFELLREIAYMASKANELTPAVRGVLSSVISAMGRLDIKHPTREYFEHYTPEERFVFLSLAYYILQVWPCNLIYESILRLKLDLPRTYPVTRIPCLKWCKSNKQFPFGEEVCNNGIGKLKDASASDVLEIKSVGVKGIRPKTLQVK